MLVNFFAAVGFIMIFFLCVTIVSAFVMSAMDDQDAPMPKREDDDEQAEYIRRWSKDRENR